MTEHTTELSCQELVELITDYLEGQLDPGRVAALDAHLAGCDGCDTYVEQMRQTVAALRGVGGAGPLPPAARERVLASFADLRAAGSP